MQFADGSRYEGEFKCNEICGQGKLFRLDNTVFSGNFKDGLPVGPGLITESKENE